MIHKTDRPKRKERNLILSATLISASICMTSNAISQDSAVVPTVANCQTIDNPTQRLECYDRLFTNDASNAGSDAEVERTVPFITSPLEKTETMEEIFDDKTKTSDFGDRSKKDELTRPVISPREAEKIAKAQPPKIKSITQRVTKIDTFGYKKIRITLENGQVWEQVGSVTQRPPKLSSKRPLTAEIRRAALNSFSLQFDGKGRAIKVRRVL